MPHLNIRNISIPMRQQLLTSGIGPRPIALVSTTSKDGIPNVSPFSFFNAFGVNPPIVAFSPARRGRDGTLKDTYYNCLKTKECTISMVSFSMVEQVSLASTEYESDIDEFVKSGLTKEKSEFVKPFGVAESPFWMECKVLDIIHTGEERGSGNIVICEILMLHIRDDVMDIYNLVDPNKADIVGRFGGSNYVRASADALFKIPKPTVKGIGFDALPHSILTSSVLTANNLARLANETKIPSRKEAKSAIEAIKRYDQFDESLFKDALEKAEFKSISGLLCSLEVDKNDSFKQYLEKAIKGLLDSNQTTEAWLLLQYFGIITCLTD